MIRGRGGFTQRNGTVVVKVKPVTAKNPANQEAVDRLNEARIKAEKNPNSNYVFTVKRALKTLADCKTPITTLSEANALKYVGPRIAKIILPDGGVLEAKPQPKPRANAKKVSTTTASTTTTLKQQRTTERKTTMKKEQGPSTKERNYKQAKLDAENLQLPKAPWKVILLIDGREVKSKHVVSKCRQSGIPCEERHLPIGDMAWIARCENDDGTTTEVMCGTIIERKEVSDLASSLFGTRYAEQRLRLQHSGLPQVLFLVEGNLNHCSNCPADTLRMAMVETRVQLGFQVVHTQHLQDTVRVLKGFHRMIVQRTFPPDSYAGEIPCFTSPEAARTGRKRRRPTSLLEMVFDSPPVPAMGAKRFITYKELKAKIELDREAGTRSVRAIYLAMLKQVATLSNKKCEAIAREHPTLNSLMTAFAASNEKRKLVQDINCERQRVGPKSAAELYVACCTQRDGKVMGHQYLTNAASAPSTNSYIPPAASKPVKQSAAPKQAATTASSKKMASVLVDSRPKEPVAAACATKRPAQPSSDLVDLTDEVGEQDALNRAIRASLAQSRNQKKGASAFSLSISSPESLTIKRQPLNLSQSSTETNAGSVSNSKTAKTLCDKAKRARLSISSSSDASFMSRLDSKPTAISAASLDLSQSSTSDCDILSPNSLQKRKRPASYSKVSEPDLLPAKTPAQAFSTARGKTVKTPASASSSSYGNFTSPDDSVTTTLSRRTPARMVSMEGSKASASSLLQDSGGLKDLSKDCDSSPLFSPKPRPVARTEKPVVLELSSDDDSGDEIFDDLKTRLGKRFKKTEVIEID